MFSGSGMNEVVIVDSDAQYIKIIEKTVRSLQKENENRGNEHEKAVCLAGAAQDGKAGYELIREKGPDLVIMDLDLPEPGGSFCCGNSGMRNGHACPDPDGRGGFRTSQTGDRTGNRQLYAQACKDCAVEESNLADRG